MTEARTIILVGGGVGLAQGLLRAMEAQDVKIEDEVRIVALDQFHTIRVVSKERMLADIEEVFEQVLASSQKAGKTLAIESLVQRLAVEAPRLHYEGRKRAQWKDETNRRNGRRR